MDNKLLFETTLPSFVKNNEITKELMKVATEKNYPIIKAKLYKKLDKYAGFAKDYMITAEQLPPIPGGWKIEGTAFEPETRQQMVNVTLKEENGKTVGEINGLVLRMIEEFKKDGLEITIEDDHKEFYGNPVRVINSVGHPILQADFEDFIENMR